MDTEEKKNLWNKKADELTVGDALKLNAAVLGITLGVIAGIGAGAVVWEKTSLKFRQMKLDRKAKKELNEE